jgi:predicted ATP-grasp superfamily ATP-dependent carboligase
LLSPVPPFIELASDKQSTAEQLNRAGVRVPKGLVLMPGERCPMGFEYPAVLKPIDGCGSLGLSLAHENMSVPRDAGAYRLETLAEGLPVSVAVLCGPAQALPLEPCRQYLEDNFSYGGGCLPLRTEHRQRAQSLALAAVKALPSTTGYVGVDLVLADAVDGSQDTVIEVNPRFTTSYVGLRAATEANLAEWCLAVSNGDRTESPSFDHAVQWDSAGNVQLGQNDALAGS